MAATTATIVSTGNYTRPGQCTGPEHHKVYVDAFHTSGFWKCPEDGQPVKVS